MNFGQHLLCFSSKLQKSVALSSGEAELSAQVGVLGIKHLFREFGDELERAELLRLKCRAVARMY